MATAGSKRVRETDSSDALSSSKRPSSQQYRCKYSETWPCLNRSQKGEHFVFCSFCKIDISVKHGGSNDCFRHVESKKHLSYAELHKKNTSITSFFSNKAQQEENDLSVTRAEVIMVNLIADYNLPLTAATEITRSVKLMFPDSAIAKRFQCGRSKATAIVKELAMQKKDDLVDSMKHCPFTISTDGSNDVATKQFPLVVRSVNLETHEVHSEVLAVPTLQEAATGENIAGLIKSTMNDNHIPWENLLALGADNASVMTGKHNGVFAHLQKQQPSLYMAGCVCHLIHICAEKASSCLPVKVDELLIDVFYYMEKSSTKQKAFRDIQLQHDMKERKILKHVSTRWLSVKRCLPRLLINWEPLKEFIKEEIKSRATNSSSQKDRLERLSQLFQSPTSRLYCLFLEHALTFFDTANTCLQCEEPKIHVLRRTLRLLFRDLCLCFLKPVAMHGKPIEEVQFVPTYHHKRDADLLIGDSATTFIKNAEKNRLRPERLAEFYGNVKKFFIVACTYLKDKLPMNDDLLGHAEVADVKEQTSSKQASIAFFLDRFPSMLPEGASRQDILREFSLYQSTSIDVDMHCERMDKTWAKIAGMKDLNGQQMFPFLPKFMLCILTIPHSSAHCERVFSCVRKTRTDQRSNISPETMDALMVLKSHPSDMPREYTQENLKKVKKCYSESLKQ